MATGTDDRIPLAQKLAERRNDAMYRLTDAVIGFSVGALALTVSLRESITRPDISHLWALRGAWCAFAGSVLWGLCARYGEIQVFQKLLERLQAGDHVVAAAPARICAIAFPLCWISFGSAVVLLTIFGVMNL